MVQISLVMSLLYIRWLIQIMADFTIVTLFLESKWRYFSSLEIRVIWPVFENELTVCLRVL